MLHTFETMQRKIIISAIILGILFSLGGFAYKYFVINAANKVSTPKTQSIKENSTQQVIDNLYAKLKAGQPVNIVFLGDKSLFNEKNVDLFIRNMQSQFRSEINTTVLTTYKGTGWSTLMSINKLIDVNSLQPDLIVLFTSQNDQLELSSDQSKTLYETVLQTAGENYPKSDIILLQPASLAQEYKTGLQDLVNHYQLPSLTLETEDANEVMDKLSDFVASRINSNFSANKISQTTPITATNKYLLWQRIEDFSQLYLMDRADVQEKVPRLVSSKRGAFVESTFTGSAVGVLLKCVPDGGMARIYIDGKKYGIIDTYSPQPEMRFVLVADDLAPGEHRVKLIVLGQAKPPSQGKRVVWYGFDITGAQEKDVHKENGA